MIELETEYFNETSKKQSASDTFEAWMNDYCPLCELEGFEKCAFKIKKKQVARGTMDLPIRLQRDVHHGDLILTHISREEMVESKASQPAACSNRS